MPDQTSRTLHRSLLSAALSTALAAACGSHPPPSYAPPPPTLRIEISPDALSDPTTIAALEVAFQDGDGPWVPLELIDGAANPAVLDPRGRYGVALSFPSQWAQVWLATLAESPDFIRRPSDYQPPAQVAKLSVIGLAAGSVVNGGYATQWFSGISDDSGATFGMSAATSSDLVLVVNESAPAPEYWTTKVLARRGLAVGPGSADVVLDAAEGLPLEEHSAPLRGLEEGEVLTVSTSIIPASSGHSLPDAAWVGLGSLRASSTSFSYWTLPARLASPGDSYRVWASSWQPDPGDGRYGHSRNYFGDLEALLAPGAELPPETDGARTLDDAGYPAWSWSLAAPQAWLGLEDWYWENDGQSSRGTSISASPAWRDGATSYSLGDLRQTPALEASARPTAGATGGWQIQLYGVRTGPICAIDGGCTVTRSGPIPVQ